MPPPRQMPPKRNRRAREPMPGGWLWVVVLVAFLIITVFSLGLAGGGGLSYTQFMQLAKEGKFKQVTLRGSRAIGELNDKFNKKPEKGDKDKTENPDKELEKYVTNGTVAVTVPKSEEASGRVTSELMKYGVDVRAVDEANSWLTPFFVVFLPIAILVAFFFLFILPRMRDPLGGGFLNSYIKSPAKRYEKSKSRITFADVADMNAAKGELQEVVEFLKNPERFQRLGAQIPKGVLLIGPPGTGKTLLARAVAGEAGVPFFSISGSEFIQMFVGVGASRVRDMFKTAKENSPCLLFVDEIDAVGRMRGAGVGGGSDEREQTLNQILSEMDGFTPNESVIVIAATNRPDVLDSALLRPGRFDRHVTIDRPTWRGRFEILKVHTRTKPLSDDVDLEQIARKMIGMTGADLRNLANEAALLATRENKSRIDRADFEHAADRIFLGPAREDVLSEDNKRRTAYHEAGHTLVSWYEPHGDPPAPKVTIVPRGRTGGVTWSPPDEERHHHGLDYFKSWLAMRMGGRAAERLIYGQPFAGVQEDLRQATQRARYMVTHWGMSDRLGPMSFRIGEEHVFLGKEIQEPRDFSETTAAIIDEEVRKILQEADERAYNILVEHREELEKLVEALMQKEELYAEEIEEILGPPAQEKYRTASGETVESKQATSDVHSNGPSNSSPGG